MKNTRRIIALCLAIVMMMSMAISASAATQSWTQDGYTYVATVTEGSSFIKYKKMTNSDVVTHTGQARTPITLYTSSFTYSAPTSEFPYSFRSYLTQALNKTSSLRNSREFSTSTRTIYVEADHPAGTYTAYASIGCKSAPWNVQRNTTDLVETGTLSYAPTSSCYFVARTTS